MNNEQLEELSKQFHRDTGVLAPFKDAPAAAANDPHYNQAHRQQVWDRWLQIRRQTMSLNYNERLDLAVSLSLHINRAPTNLYSEYEINRLTDLLQMFKSGGLNSILDAEDQNLFHRMLDNALG